MHVHVLDCTAVVVSGRVGIPVTGLTIPVGWLSLPQLTVLSRSAMAIEPRAHLAKFYGRLRSIRSVWRASNFSLIKIVILWVYYNIPFRFSLFWHFWSFLFNFGTTCLAQDHWWGFSTRNAHIVHIVNLIRLKMVYTS